MRLLRIKSVDVVNADLLAILGLALGAQLISADYRKSLHLDQLVNQILILICGYLGHRFRVY